MIEKKKPVNLKTAINKNNQILIIERKKIFKKSRNSVTYEISQVLTFRSLNSQRREMN